MIAKQNLNYGGRLFMAGEKVDGFIDMQMMAKLLENGVVEPESSESELTDAVASETSVPSAPSVEDFGKMGADDQKQHLEKIGVEPGSNAKERAEQYEAYLSSLSVGDGHAQP